MSVPVRLDAEAIRHHHYEMQVVGGPRPLEAAIRALLDDAEARLLDAASVPTAMCRCGHDIDVHDGGGPDDQTPSLPCVECGCDEFRDTPGTGDAPRWCQDQGGTGSYVCTLPKEHGGEHRAVGLDRTLYDRWPNKARRTSPAPLVSETRPSPKALALADRVLGGMDPDAMDAAIDGGQAAAHGLPETQGDEPDQSFEDLARDLFVAHKTHRYGYGRQDDWVQRWFTHTHSSVKAPYYAMARAVAPALSIQEDKNHA